jgi:hypothetical protein
VSQSGGFEPPYTPSFFVIQRIMPVELKTQEISFSLSMTIEFLRETASVVWNGPRSIHISHNMSIGWDVKRCPVTRITTPLARKRETPKISTPTKQFVLYQLVYKYKITIIFSHRNRVSRRIAERLLKWL